MGLFGPNIRKMKHDRDISGLLSVVKGTHGRKTASEAAKALAELGSRASEPYLVVSLLGAFRKSNAKTRNLLAWVIGTMARNGNAQLLVEEGAARTLLEGADDARSYKDFALPLAALGELARAGEESSVVEALSKVLREDEVHGLLSLVRVGPRPNDMKFPPEHHDIIYRSRNVHEVLGRLRGEGRAPGPGGGEEPGRVGDEEANDVPEPSDSKERGIICPGCGKVVREDWRVCQYCMAELKKGT